MSTAWLLTLACSRPSSVSKSTATRQPSISARWAPATSTRLLRRSLVEHLRRRPWLVRLKQNNSIDRALRVTGARDALATVRMHLSPHHWSGVEEDAPLRSLLIRGKTTPSSRDGACLHPAR